MKRSRADMFRSLGAPLRNPQWSWGAERKVDGAVFLVVWQDESRTEERRHYSLVYNKTFWGDRTDSNGLNERQKHLDLVRQGKKTYLIMALAEKDRSANTPRRIVMVNAEELFKGGGLVEDSSGDVWIERLARIPVGQVRLAGE